MRSVVTALATAALIWLQTIVQLTVIWGVIVGLMSGVLGIPLGAALASQWFVERRGLVVGILGAGSSAGALIWVPIFMNVTVTQAGGRRCCSARCCCCILMPLVLLVVRDSPARSRAPGVRRRARAGQRRRRGPAHHLDVGGAADP